MTTDKNERIIKLSKIKLLLITLGAFGFVVAGQWMWTIGGAAISFGTIILKGLALLSIVFFGLCGLYGLRKLFDFKAGLIINGEGLLDNSSALGGHLIKWTDIKGVEIERVKNTRFLLIFVNNPQHYIAHANSFKRFWMKMNDKIYGTPLSISSNTLQCNFDELIATINERRTAASH